MPCRRGMSSSTAWPCRKPTATPMSLRPRRVRIVWLWMVARMSCGHRSLERQHCRESCTAEPERERVREAAHARCRRTSKLMPPCSRQSCRWLSMMGSNSGNALLHSPPLCCTGMLVKRRLSLSSCSGVDSFVSSAASTVAWQAMRASVSASSIAHHRSVGVLVFWPICRAVELPYRLPKTTALIAHFHNRCMPWHVCGRITRR